MVKRTTQAEEVEAGRTIRAALNRLAALASEAGVHTPATPERWPAVLTNASRSGVDVTEMRAAYAAANDAAWGLAHQNLRLASMLAAKIATTGQYAFEDGFHEALIGLAMAGRRYDPDRGIRFGTFGLWWAKACITKAVSASGRVVRFSGYASELTWRLARAARQMPEATFDELCDYAGVAPHLATAIMAANAPQSLDDPDVRYDPPAAITGRPVLSGEHDASSDAAADSVMIGRLRAALPMLPDRERRLIEYRFGFDSGGRARSLQETAALEGSHVSRERTRQLIERAILRLRMAMGVRLDVLDAI